MIQVLVVDDSPVVQKLLLHVLQSDPGLQVIGTAGDGAAALEFLQRQTPDVITMDIHMPRLDGLEATRKIMETRPVPIVIVSGNWNPRRGRHDVPRHGGGGRGARREAARRGAPRIYGDGGEAHPDCEGDGGGQSDPAVAARAACRPCSVAAAVRPARPPKGPRGRHRRLDRWPAGPPCPPEAPASALPGPFADRAAHRRRLRGGPGRVAGAGHRLAAPRRRPRAGPAGGARVPGPQRRAHGRGPEGAHPPQPRATRRTASGRPSPTCSAPSPPRMANTPSVCC